MNSYMTNNFNNLIFQKPLFYNWPIGIRFEIGPENIELWKDDNYKNYNEEYFDVALNRATTIFEMLFEEEDDISIVYQQYSDGRRKIKKGNFIYKQIIQSDDIDYLNEDIRDIYELDNKSECWKRLTISNLKIKNLNYINILKSLINIDFNRKPSVDGECFIVNKSKGIIFNLYDDRGLDVISIKKENLLDLYTTHNDWILNYDRTNIDKVFS